MATRRAVRGLIIAACRPRDPASSDEACGRTGGAWLPLSASDGGRYGSANAKNGVRVKPDIPSPEEVDAMFLRDVFSGAVDALEHALWPARAP
jgi:hypothetical protein